MAHNCLPPAGGNVFAMNLATSILEKLLTTFCSGECGELLKVGVLA